MNSFDSWCKVKLHKLLYLLDTTVPWKQCVDHDSRCKTLKNQICYASAPEHTKKFAIKTCPRTCNYCAQYSGIERIILYEDDCCFCAFFYTLSSETANCSYMLFSSCYDLDIFIIFTTLILCSFISGHELVYLFFLPRQWSLK